MGIALVIALLSAGLFATGSSLQHRQAETAPSSSRVGLLAGLLRRREWLIGASLCAVAFALHATALHLGSLTLVQPVIMTGIVFTVIIRAAIDHRRPSRAELAWAALTWGGLVLFLATLRTGAAQPASQPRAAVLTVVGLALAAGLVLLARRTRRPPRRGALLAAAAGTLFGLVAGLVKISTTEATTQGLAALALSWPPWVLAVAGVGAVALNQLAYRSTRLSVTTPVLNILQLVVALTFGFVVFAEKVLDTPLTVVGQLIGLLAMGVGVVRLAARAVDDPTPAHVAEHPTT